MMAAELNHASLDCEAELFCIKVLFLAAIAFATSKDLDTMYLHQAMMEPDRDKFIAATMVEEMDAQLKERNFLLILRSLVPRGTTVSSKWSGK